MVVGDVELLKSARVTLLAGVAALLLQGCSGNVSQEAEPAVKKSISVTDLAHHRWVLESIDGEIVELTSHVSGRKKQVVELDFGEAEYVGGFAGCNQYSGQFELNEMSQFRVAQLATTMMMCAEEATRLEQRYTSLLNQWSDIALDGTVLTLTQNEQVWIFKLFDWVQ